MNAIQKLISKEYIRLKEQIDLENRKILKLEWEILPDAEGIIGDLIESKSRYWEVMYSGLTEEEIMQYELLSAKIKENVKKQLQ